MWKILVVLALVATVVLADNYWCPKSGEVFQCFESDAEGRFCLTKDRQSKVVCSKCRKKLEFCRNGLEKSKRPETDCGAGWENTPCTPDNTDVPDIY